MRGLNIIIVVALVGSLTGLIFSIGILGNQRRQIAQYEFREIEMLSRDSARIELADELRLQWELGRLDDRTATSVVAGAVGRISDYFVILLEIGDDGGDFRIFCTNGGCRVQENR